MMTSTAEDLSKDNDVIHILQRMEICKGPKVDNITADALGETTQVKYKKKKFYYRPPYDSIDDAQSFNKVSQFSDKDTFLKELLFVLGKNPSIKVKSIKNMTKCSSKVKKQEQLMPQAISIGNELNSVRNQQINISMSKRKCIPVNKLVNTNVQSSTLFKTKVDECKKLNRSDYKSPLSEHSKRKSIDLIRMLIDSSDDSFANSFLDCRREFLELLPLIDSIQQVIPQTLEIILRIFRLELSLKRNIIPNFLHDEFVDKLISYITLLPTECDESVSESDIDNFFQNILLFCENINMYMPSKSTVVVRKFVLSLQYSMRGISDVRGIHLSEALSKKAVNLLENTNSQRTKQNKKKIENREENESMLEPPDSIKNIDIFPTKRDLFEAPTFLRKNVVDGSYKDVNHYIDVQFRLLREDFIAPLRCGIQQYCETVTRGNLDERKCFDNIKIHEDVKILHGTFTNGRLGHLVEFQSELDLNSNSNRLIFGSLLLFTADHFNTFFCATVINLIDSNLLVVELYRHDVSVEDICGTEYTVIESEIYFEPYFHVLTALQKLDCESFPMKEYIVDVKPNIKVAMTKNLQGCPSNLNHSQRKAFESAMASEFVVIQGPPGTGKTFLAEAIAKNILLNKGPMKLHLNLLFNPQDESDDEHFHILREGMRTRKHKNDYCVYRSHPTEKKVFHIFFCEIEQYSRPILVICYTNHALDQFLERLISCTKRVVRIGGQSKNTTVQKFNLNEIRNCWTRQEQFNRRRCNCFSCRRGNVRNKMYFEYLQEHKRITFHYLFRLKLLEAIATGGILKMNVLGMWINSRICMLLNGQYEVWLLEGANALPLQDEDIKKNVEPETIIHTQQLISEFRKIYTNWDDEEMDDQLTIDAIDAETNKRLFVRVNELLSKSLKIRKKLRTLRQKGGNEDKIYFFESQIDDLEKKQRYISHMLALKIPVDLKKVRELNRMSNIWSINFEDRWMLYNFWVQQYVNSVKGTMLFLESMFKENQMKSIKIKEKLNLQILKSSNIIGMTTTSAARLKEMVEQVGPEIVLVEEAAEVLEAHVVVSLSSTVKKVILIGDHKQLKPNPAVYQLAQQYKLDISLFERMINNGLVCQVLDTQQRMRPEIASLIAPAIYPDLKNGDHVLNRPDIRGVLSNVFFVTHNCFEDEIPDTRSHCNTHEATFLMSFCQYLFQQGYKPDQITVLVTYLGQITAMENERRRRKLPSDLRITTVDNYQGEENEIILLSLVRSNADARIGFLSAENRVCVALSRSKNGLYIIGNMENLTRRTVVWQQVKSQLESMNAIGPALTLGCKNHPNRTSLVSKSNDFKEVPTSGCKMKCEMKLPCGHICLEFCHSLDPDHIKEFSCPKPCERMACEEHRCQKTCGEDCGGCSVIVEKALPCGHSAQLECSDDAQVYLCKELLTVELKTCGHTATKFCYSKYDPSCKELCPDTLKCGHPCQRFCHAKNVIIISETNNPHSKEFCSIKIEKTLQCGHVYTIECCESDREVACQEPCPKTLNCGHPCNKQCSQKCEENCEILVEKTLPLCGHNLMLPCNKRPESSQCRQPCQLTLSCGHPCTSTCSADCSSVTCQEIVECSVEPACGHGFILIPCHLNVTGVEVSSDQLLQFCKAPCRADLPCGHICVGRCGDCMQGRLHVPCNYPCSKSLHCGHRCERECSNECPAICEQPCLYQCPHQTCTQICGEPCPPCQSACKRRCSHQRCSRMCHEDCDVPPCGEPCQTSLLCGHTCTGYCGEPCSKQCVVCSPEAFVVPGYAFSRDFDIRYVVIEDCGHSIEDHLLREVIFKNQSVKVKKCPMCDSPIKYVSRYKDFIKDFHSNLVNAKTEEKDKLMNFEVKMKREKYDLKYYDRYGTEIYGDHAIFILEDLKKGHYEYKTSMWVLTFFKQLTKSDLYAYKKDKYGEAVIERRKLLLKALSLRLKSMSSSDYNEFLTEIFRLELATKDWPTHCDLMLSLKKYSLDELKALR